MTVTSVTSARAHYAAAAQLQTEAAQLQAEARRLRIDAAFAFLKAYFRDADSDDHRCAELIAAVNAMRGEAEEWLAEREADSAA
jgi:hypothetical protein